jgi:hypothetical protein
VFKQLRQQDSLFDNESIDIEKTNDNSMIQRQSYSIRTKMNLLKSLILLICVSLRLLVFIYRNHPNVEVIIPPPSEPMP